MAGGVFPLALGGTAALVSPALAREPYTAPPIPVDVSADSPAAARQKAIDEGQVKALRALLQSMVPAGDQTRLPPVDAARADAMVVDFSLDNERTTAKRYLATITVRFNAAKVDQLLSQTGVARVRPRETPVLILPVYQAAPSAAPLLWEDTNPWGATWAHATGLKEGLVPLVLALGDIEDVGIIDGKRALGGDKTAASRLAARNGAPDAVIVHVQGAPETGLTVTLRGVGVFTDLKPFTVAAGPKAFETALAKVRTTLEESWKTLSTQPAPSPTPTDTAMPSADPASAALPPPAVSAVPPGLGWQTGTAPLGATDPTGLAPPTALGPTPSAQPPASATMTPPTSASPVILARFASLAEWVEIRRRLQGLPGGGAMALQAVSRDQAQFILPWSGSLPDLQAQMQSRGLSLTKHDGMWVLEAQGAAVPGMAPR